MSRSPATVAASLALVALLLAHPAAAMRVRPTQTSVTFEVGDEEVCMYSSGRDFYEGVSMHYHVLRGGDDFDLRILDPDNQVIYSSYAGEHGMEDRVYFTTRSAKEYSYCIDNRGYSKERKSIKMNIGITSLKRWKTRIDPLDRLMSQAEGYFLGMIDDQMMIRLRETSLREQLEKTFTLMSVRAITEALIIVVITLVNVVLITYLFKRSRSRVA